MKILYLWTLKKKSWHFQPRSWKQKPKNYGDKIMIENIKMTTVHYYLRNSMVKIYSEFTETYPKKTTTTTTKGLFVHISRFAKI